VIYLTWWAARTNKPLLELDREYSQKKEEAEALFQQVIHDDIPLTEMLDYVFLFEHVSVALREQLVRHRIGTKVGGALGMDIVPDQHTSTWWCQSMRCLDLGDFATQKRYLLPESITSRPYADQAYRMLMMRAQDTYHKLQALGVPVEDARNVVPLAVEHRLMWKANLTAIRHVMCKRSCWIAQLGMWQPVVEGLSTALAKVHHALRTLTNPPCIQGKNQWTGCKFLEDNARRVCCDDPAPPCPLYLQHHTTEACVALAGATSNEHCWDCIPTDDSTLAETLWEVPAHQEKIFQDMCRQFAALWHRDPWTGELNA
jgi:thymidylate synthase ThyX